MFSNRGALSVVGRDGGLVSGLAIAASLFTMTPAFAQSAGGEHVSEDGGIGDIVVTARRREEALQTAPVAVTALSGEDLEDKNILQLTQIDSLVPNAVFTESSGSGGAPALFIRGQGSTSTSLYQEPSVGVYVDGVYMPRATGNVFDLPDVAGVQVLRGPQGTLFGRNTTGGAVLLTTQTPAEEFGGSVNFSYASNNDMNIAFVGHTGELGDSGIRAKLSFRDHQRDGWVEYPGFPESEWGGFLRTRQVDFDVMVTPTDNLSIRNKINWSRFQNEVPWQILIASPRLQAVLNQSVANGGPPPLVSRTPLDLQYRDPRRTNNTEVEAWSDTLTVDWEFGPAFAFKSISAYRTFDQNLTTTLGGSIVTVPVQNYPATTTSLQPFAVHTTTYEPGEQEQFSQEFQISGDLGEFNYVAGLFYWDEETHERIDVTNGIPQASLAAFNTNRATIRTYRLTTESVAAFGQIGYRPAALDDKLEISVGLRYTEDKQGLLERTSYASIPGSPAASNAPTSAEFDDLGYSGSISYKWTPDVMTYFSTSSGFRAGGYNGTGQNSPPFAEETVTNYEFGFKSQWFDRAVTLNLASFYMDYTDLQLLQFDPILSASVVSNVGAATIQGFEVEAIFNITDNFRIDGNYGYTDAQFDEYSPNGVNVARIATFPYVPEHNFNIGAQYVSNPMSMGVMTLRADYSYASSTSRALLNDGAFGNNFRSGIDRNLSARFILSDIPLPNANNLKFQVFGENLTDNRYEAYSVNLGATLGAVTGSFNRPRYFGIALSADF